MSHSLRPPRLLVASAALHAREGLIDQEKMYVISMPTGRSAACSAISMPPSATPLRCARKPRAMARAQRSGRKVDQNQ